MPVVSRPSRALDLRTTLRSCRSFCCWVGMVGTRRLTARARGAQSNTDTSQACDGTVREGRRRRRRARQAGRGTAWHGWRAWRRVARRGCAAVVRRGGAWGTARSTVAVYARLVSSIRKTHQVQQRRRRVCARQARREAKKRTRSHSPCEATGVPAAARRWRALLLLLPLLSYALLFLLRTRRCSTLCSYVQRVPSVDRPS